VTRSWIERRGGGFRGSCEKSAKSVWSIGKPWASWNWILTRSREQIDSVIVCSTWRRGLISRK
jgi:hypothetical protein